MAISDYNCQSKWIAAYLDGQLEDPADIQFEAHLASCQPCRSELTKQRQFMCELDSALARDAGSLPIPQDFARRVSAHAVSDMRGVREGEERRRAFLFCVALGSTAFALLGATAGKSILVSSRLLANKVLGVFELLWNALHDAITGLTIISRVVSRVFLPETLVANLAALILLALAVASLSHLIVRYHRRNQMRLFDRGRRSSQA
ncbi:MAG: anti-sigma factor family protein [Pyrinomonadaceae bacterium]